MTNTVTIKDIANELNLSYSTVSLCLNSSPRVNSETMRRVKEAAKQMGYAKNARAHALVTRRSQLIGIVVPDIANPFFSAIMRGAESVAIERGYHLMILNTDRRVDLESRHLNLIIERKIDALLITSIHNKSELLDGILDRRLPLVFINNPYPHPNADFVGSDGYQIGRLAAKHLTACGHTDITVCGVHSQTEFHRQLMEGFIDILSTDGVPWDAGHRIDGTFSLQSGYESGLQVLSRRKNTTAIFAFDDVIALGVIQALEENGVRVPEDISVMGCDDVFLASLPRIGLTTVRQQTENMGRVAMEALLHSLTHADGDHEESQRIVLPSELIVRKTTGPAPAR